MALIPNTAPTKSPTVTVSKSAAGAQTRVAFNAPLARQAELADVPFMTIDYDPDGLLTFIATSESVYHGIAAFPVLRDGGRSEKNTTSRALYLHKNALPDLKPGKYAATIKKLKSGVRIVISLTNSLAS